MSAGGKDIAMKRISFAAFGFVLVALLFSSSAAAESVESGLQNMLKQFIGAWDRSDAHAIAALFEDNSDLVIPTGLLVEGRDGIEKFYTYTFERGYRGSRSSANIKHTRLIRPDMVMVDGEWRIDGALIDGRAEAPEVGVFSLVARRRGRAWAICSLREQDGARILTRFADGTLSGPSQSNSEADSAAGPSVTAGRTAIEELDRKDIEASKKNDVDALVALWTEDGVLLQPGSAPVVGKPAIREMLQQQREQAAQVVTLAYNEKWDEVLIENNHAIEWGRISATVKLPNAQEVQQSVGAIRVLVRQPDGSWRFARVAITPAVKQP
jgi:uncharacterized protein (TIGR02246 family)